MELADANAIEFLGKKPLMIVKKGYDDTGFFLTRTLRCSTLDVHIGRVLVFWVDGAEYSYNGEYLVHWGA